MKMPISQSQKVIRRRERSRRKVIPMNNLRVIMYYGRRIVFSLGCCTRRIIYCNTVLM
jgi:hypothetical protein